MPDRRGTLAVWLSIGITALACVTGVVVPEVRALVGLGGGDPAPTASPSPTGTRPPSASPPGEPPPQTPTATVSPVAGPLRLAGTWEGYYRCRGDKRGLRLVVTPIVDGEFRATAEFFPLPGGPAIQSGSFAMLGTQSREGIVLEPDYWIERAAGYVMLGMSATVAEPEPTRLTGTMTGGCDGFALDKQSDEWSEPPP